ncbi:MAG: hypothetical protein HGA65_08685 [Oscillochloris sp.]|nr:hypothetical protein [Oscillochloris sp.]
MPKKSSPIEIVAVVVVIVLIVGLGALLLQMRSRSTTSSSAENLAVATSAPTARPATATPAARPASPTPQMPSATASATPETPTAVETPSASVIDTASQTPTVVAQAAHGFQGVWKATGFKTDPADDPGQPAFALQIDLRSDGTAELKMVDIQLRTGMAEELIDAGRYSVIDGKKILFQMDQPSTVLGNMFGTVKLAFPNMHNVTPGAAIPTPELHEPPPLQSLACNVARTANQLTLSHDGITIIFDLVQP